MRRRTFWVAGLFVAVIVPSLRADWRLDGGTGINYESNLSNSDRASDVQDDFSWETGVQLANGFQVTRDLRFILAADLRSLLWAHFYGFDEVDAGLSGTLRYRFGLGAQAPWISLSQRIGYNHFRENFRSGWDESVRLRIGVGVTPRLALEAGYTFENLATAGDFFDQQSHGGDLRLTYDLTPSLQVGVGYAYRSGDVISYAVPARPDIFSIARVRENVTTFGNSPAYNAYRLLGRTHAVSVSAAYNLSKYLSLELSYEYSQTSHDPLTYQNHFVAGRIAFAY
jgi:predicted porin